MGQEKSVSLSITMTITIISLIVVLASIQPVVVCLQCHQGIVTNDKSPRLTVIQEHKLSSSVSKNPSFIAVNVTHSTNRSNTIFGRSGDRFKFICTAPYMTRWTSSITPKLEAIYEHPNRFSQNPLKLIEGAILVSNFSITLPEGKSGFVKCECVSNETLATGVYIYTLDGEDLTAVTRSEIQPPIFTDTSQNFILPCNANYPNVTAKLGISNATLSNGNNSDFIELDASFRVGDYDPQVGFVVRGRENATERTFQYFCATGNQKLVFNVYNTKQDVDKNNTIQIDIGYGCNNEIPVGTSCKLAGSTEPIQIQMINCNSEYECDWLNNCFYTKCKNNGVTPREGINTIVDSFTRGKLRCISNGKIINEAHDYVFIGIKTQRQYLLSQLADIPTTDLIKIIMTNETEKILYTNEPTAFECKITDFILVSNIKFAALFQNGTISLLDKINATRDPALIREGKVLGFTRKKILVNLTLDMVGIMCLAPLRTSPEWINTTREFQVKDVEAPYIHYQPLARDILEGTINSNPFYVGDTTRTLECNATGEPAPNIQWVVPEEVSDKFAYINTEEALLRFPTIDPSFQGQYICSATNEYGSYSQVYDVDVHSPNEGLLSPKSVAIAGGLFSLLAIGLVFFIRKYMRAKRKIRKLSAQDIADFIYGKQERLKHEVQADLLEKESLSKINSGFEFSTPGLSVTVDDQDCASLKDKVDSRADSGDDISMQSDVSVSSFVEVHGLDFQTAVADDKQNVPEIITEDQVQSMSFNRDFEIKSSDLVIGSKIGEGKFGEVYLGSFKGIQVAVKTTKETADLEYVKALLSEIKIMQYIRTWSHPNIVQYLGAVISEIKSGKVLVVVELSNHGCLESILEKQRCYFSNLLNKGSISLNGKPYDQVKRELTVLNLVNWCEQIASGMDFLASKKVIHGDLAARNVLMFENDIVKITDFGLSKQLYDDPFYKKKIASNQKGYFPVPWMAIESLRYLQFSSQSDVWSFGVTAWEIFTLGQTPVVETNIQAYIDTLLTGARLGKPDFATDAIYAKLLKCWRINPDKRPSFFSLKKFFRSTLKSMRSTLEAEASTQPIGNGAISHYTTMATLRCDNNFNLY